MAIGGVEYHVHILAMLRPKTAVAVALNTIEANSSGWVHQEWPHRRAFAWQIGYAAFTVSHSNLDDVKRYILRAAAAAECARLG